MLVLSRKQGQRLMIGEDVVLIINKIAGNRVSIAIEAPKDLRVVRGELAPLEMPSGSPRDVGSCLIRQELGLPMAS